MTDVTKLFVTIDEDLRHYQCRDPDPPRVCRRRRARPAPADAPASLCADVDRHPGPGTRRPNDDLLHRSGGAPAAVAVSGRRSDRALSDQSRTPRGQQIAFDALPATAALEWASTSTSLASIALYDDTARTLTTPGGQVRLAGLSATPDLFDVLGTPPLIGHTFGASDRDVRQIVLSHATWQRSLRRRRVGDRIARHPRRSGSPHCRRHAGGVRVSLPRDRAFGSRWCCPREAVAACCWRRSRG